MILQPPAAGGPCVLVCFCSPPRAARMSSAHFNISGFVDPFCGVKHSRQCGQMFIAALVHHHCSLFRPNPRTTATTMQCYQLAALEEILKHRCVWVFLRKALDFVVFTKYVTNTKTTIWMISDFRFRTLKIKVNLMKNVNTILFSSH